MDTTNYVESPSHPQEEEVDYGEEKPNEIKITRPMLTKYEKTRIIGSRATQIALVAPSRRVFKNSLHLFSL